MSEGRLQAPVAKDARPAPTDRTVASPAAAGPAAAGPKTGERNPKMPAKVSPAEADIDRTDRARVAGVLAGDFGRGAGLGTRRCGGRHGELADGPFDDYVFDHLDDLHQDIGEDRHSSLF
jgi:hypothetical protein